MFENPRRGRQARNFTKNVPKILDLKSSSEQVFSENCRWVLDYKVVRTVASRNLLPKQCEKNAFVVYSRSITTFFSVRHTQNLSCLSLTGNSLSSTDYRSRSVFCCKLPNGFLLFSRFPCRWCCPNDNQSDCYFDGSDWKHQLWHSYNACPYDRQMGRRFL